jgi:putative endopeptidase
MAQMFRTRLMATSAAALLALSVGVARAHEGHDHAPDAQAAAAASPTGGATAESLASPKFGTWGFDLSGMDRSVKPGDDFYAFVNGKWAERTEIPADRVRYGSGDALQALSEARVRAILDDAVAGKLDHPDAAKIAAAYGAFMDEARVEALDARPLAPELAMIRKVKSRADFTALMAKSNTTGFTSVLPVQIFLDSKAPDRYVLLTSNSGLGLPDRDYYLQASFADKKVKYEAYIARMLTMIGWDKPAENARAIVAFETKMAEVSMTRVEQRDLDKTYNPMTPAELAAYTPDFDWKSYLAAADLPKADKIIVWSKPAFPKITAIYAATPVDTLKAWQAFHLTDGAAPYLSKRFVDARFEFKGKELAGQKELAPRWKRAARWMDGALGESVGKVYVARYFPPETKAKALELVTNVRSAMRGRIENLAWMGPATKAKALEKLDRLGLKIGYPDQWLDYSALEMKPDDLYGNVMRSSVFEWRRQVARFDQPVDRTEWGLTPQTVNAYYHLFNIEIAFPAAYLQPPFFDPDADPAVNYGAVGATIGHEITHGFDDQGRKADARGVLTDWWQPEDDAKFKAQAGRLTAQFDAFEPFPGVKVQGALSLGENIADLGGLKLALDAYHASLKGAPAPVIDGFTGDQRVFLGYAQAWREKAREDFTRAQIATGPHAPSFYRVMGPLRNIQAWYDAWDIKPGDKLYIPPEQRVNIW